jgi:hypothetical protein
VGNMIYLAAGYDVDVRRCRSARALLHIEWRAAVRQNVGNMLHGMQGMRVMSRVRPAGLACSRHQPHDVRMVAI